ncbi:restriction endonuclease subunit S [Aerococcus urinaeequi]|uniref:restriction endonuclease subunit S n=1 Tax=Aerococcus urinaeequi TaxID=51665 RepID=UPI003AC02574
MSINKDSQKAPNLRFKGFTDDWEQRELIDVSKITMGQSPNGANYTQNPRDYILVQGNADMKNGEVVPRIWTTQVTKVANVNDIILGVRAPVGVVGITKYDVVIGRGVAGIKGNTFIYYDLVHKYYNNYWTKYSTGSTFDSINTDDIKNASIHLPKFEEQTRIGSFLKNLDNTITLHQRKLDQLNQLKEALLQQIFPGKGETVPRLRFAGFEGDWEERKLSTIGNTFTGLSGKTKEDFGHGEAKYIPYTNIFNNPITDVAKLESIEIDNKQNSVVHGDILFTTSSETPEEVGMSSVWMYEKENVYLNSFCFGFRPIEKHYPLYLAYLLRSPYMRKKFTILAQGISRYNISKNKVLELTISLPSISEQTKIGDTLKHLDDIITLQQRKLDQLKNMKQVLLQNMFI